MIRKAGHYVWKNWYAWRPVKATQFSGYEDHPEYFWVWFEHIERMTTPGLSRYRLTYTFWQSRRKK